MTETKEPLSNISDSSFIILGQGSLPSSINGEAADVKFSDKNQNTFVFFKPDRNSLSKSFDGESFSEDDVQEKLKQLIRENCQLKETLGQNNLAIKSQLDTFYMWQQEVLKTHEAHKKKFMETKELILKLRMENLNLKKQMDESFCSLHHEDDSNSREIDACDDCIMKLENQNLKVLFESLRNKNKLLAMENKKLEEKLNATEKEVIKLKSLLKQENELEDGKAEEKFLMQENGGSLKNSVTSLSHGPLPNSEARVQINNLFKQLEMERDKVSKLKEKLKKGTDVKGEDLSESQKSLCRLNLSLDCHNQRYNNLHSWVKIDKDNCDDADQNSSREENEPKSHICQEDACQHKKNYEALNDLFNKVLENNKDLEEKLKTRSDEHDVEECKIQVLNLSQMLETKENELSSKEKECDELKEENKKLKLECEEVAILKVQVEVYQNDFNDERSARERLVAEKEEMAEQIRHLQSKLEAFEKGPKGEEPQEEAEVSNSFFRPYKGKKCNYICPKCMFSFSDLRRCQEHVDECLNIHFYP